MLWSPIAAAELKYFPMWERLTCGDAQFACYDFEKSKLILKVDLDVQKMAAELDAANEKSTKLEEARKNLHEAVQIKDAEIVRLNVRLKEKHEVLEKTTLELKKAESNHVVTWLPWIGLVVLVVGGAAFGGGYYLADKN
jgi:hypothetical protein